MKPICETRNCEKEGKPYPVDWHPSGYIVLCSEHYQQNKNGILKQGAEK